ncbi:peptidase M24A, methionine aminopeptidase [Acaromyces ingoldii]|uniref:Methionine aminopeptidase 2 n=1 Tax=Acaromyces ingoldii TaxID=215250 RepID=A0A316YVF0_9BASI|nr:peptidase M24A, methionine aminopeptidase [Acaromyces ingoldii]PWN92764.1 peptidase M24A, methionine aminopeptidase [Acaromyces ingoldii]
MPATAVETAGANGVADKLASATLVESNGKDESGAEDEEEKKAKAAKEKAGVAQVQSEPPRVGLTKIFLDGCYPMGEFQDYDETKFTDDTRSRRTPEELRERERLLTEGEGNNLNLIRRAAEAHRQVRAYAQKAIKPGMSMTDIVHVVEDGTRAVIEEDGFEAGIGFPTGVSLNECAAHYTPNAGDKRILQQGDVLKVDFGVHVQGRIVDSAFTLTFEDQSPWQPLLDAVKAATNEGVKQSGIDARLGEIGASIQEVMESHEFEALGKTHQVKCVKNLNGHSIDRYRIHGGKSVPIVAVPNLDQKMEEGEYFAIETFGSTGKGYVMDSGDCSHYARKVNPPHVNLRVASARPLLHTINKNFGSLPFCRRYLDRLGEKNYLLGLKHLVSQGIVQDYPPLSDIPGSMTAQYEHTIYLGPSKKEVVSRGEDY